jgi:hypothetical protein
MADEKICGVIAVVILMSATLIAIPVPVDVQNVPVDRVIVNLERQVTERAKDAGLRVNLARVHAMAYAMKSSTVPSGTRRGGSNEIVPWAGYFVPEFRQFDVKNSGEPMAMAAAREHLSKAIARYREALLLAPDNLVAQMGLGWTLSESGDKAEAIRVLRGVVAASLPFDRPGARVMHGQRSLTEEAVRYLVPLLDPVTDRDEIVRLESTASELAKQLRPITPIAVPLADGLTADDVVDESAAVSFDLDGSALPQRWNWIRPNAAWLAFDRRGARSIASGLQLFGNVTFWLFWTNGYDALQSLDDDVDGSIAGAELAGLALWHDRNGNARSEPGEVSSVSDWGIVALSCQYHYDARHPDEIAVSTRGVTFRDGTSRPTYDLILHSAR